MTPTFIISAEEKALLDAAKRVCQQWGHIDGKLITHKEHSSEADALLVEQIQCGRVVVGGRYLCDRVDECQANVNALNKSKEEGQPKQEDAPPPEYAVNGASSFQVCRMSKSEAISRLGKVAEQHGEDAEVAHEFAIQVLLGFLTTEGHADLVDVYHAANVGFWHS